MGSGPDGDYQRAKRLLAADATAERASGLDLLRALAAAGHARAQFRLGLLLARGEAGAARDEAEALRWCRAAAEQGLGKAQFNLGLLYACGNGVGADAAIAEHWLRLAVVNGVDEAERCLDLVHADARERPSTWQEAETHASVALVRSDAEGGKAMRFAEYYVDPCIDVLIKHLQLDRERSEDIVQQFMCELEEPLSKGEHRGRPWKDSLRARFTAGLEDGQQRFRPYLYRVLVNFARDCLRAERRKADQTQSTDPALDPALVREQHADDWRAMLAAFAQAVGPAGNGTRAVDTLHQLLVDGADLATIAERGQLNPRTVRKHLRLATGLLTTWLGNHLAAHRLDDDRLCQEGLRQLPDWLHFPSEAKRIRVLLFLALVHRRGQRQGR